MTRLDLISANIHDLQETLDKIENVKNCETREDFEALLKLEELKTEKLNIYLEKYTYLKNIH